MPKPLEEIIKQTDAEFFRLHPELKNGALGVGSENAAGSKEAALRKEWTRLLLKRQGEMSEEDLKGVAGGVGTSHILVAAHRVMAGA
jgi:hypothetical protein